MQPHVLFNQGALVRAQLLEQTGGDMRVRKNKRKRGASHGGNSGKCAYEGCAVTKPKRAQTKCQACDKYLHLQCYFQEHLATFVGHENMQLPHLVRRASPPLAMISLSTNNLCCALHRCAPQLHNETRMSSSATLWPINDVDSEQSN